ncbi:MAG: tetratricopeptide repeat protein [Muribaculaceae bacterium]|nr:tetratricopeptide repeat protein [Muribaculaceae bacterium]
MKHIITILAAVLCITTASAQVITQLGKESMNIPRGIRPDKPTSTGSVGTIQITDMDTTGTYFACIDSAQIYTDSQDWQKAQHFLRRAIAADPQNPNNSLLLSNIATMQRFEGRYADAVKNYSMALDLTPNAVTVLLNRAALYITIDSTALAQADFERVCQLDPTNTEARYSLGMLEVERHNFKQAEKYFEQIKAINPHSGLASEGMANLYKANGNYSKAAQCFSEVIKARPNASLLANRADCYLMLKQLNNAEEDIRNALTMTPDDPYLYVLRAKLNKFRFERQDMERDINLAVSHGLDRDLVNNLLK